MNKKILILSLMSLILVVGCQSNDDFYTYEKVICNNQSVWDNRVGYDDFNCKMLKRNYPAIRDCVATNYYIKNDKVVIMSENLRTDVITLEKIKKFVIDQNITGCYE